jgi:C_GCAxxG_C_C family probable redox protein
MESTELFKQNLNCAQSVFVPHAAKFFPDPKLAFKIMSPFGGGISSTDNLCGAVTGACAAIGLYLGHTSGNEVEEKARCAKATQEFIAAFKARHGHITCTPLLGHNMSVAGEREKAQQEKKFETVCSKLVASASEIVDEIIAKYNPAK